MKNKIPLFLMLLLFFSCREAEKEQKSNPIEIVTQKEFFIVPGEDDPVDSTQVKKGKVQISYSDCYECHKLDQDATGPSFNDIARRYPYNETYIEFLSRKIISGGSGTWGTPVMRAHPNLSQKDARQMVNYILSLDIK